MQLSLSAGHAIIRRMHHEGLKDAYESEDTFPKLRKWLRSLVAVSMLPSFAIPLIWKELQLPPVTHSDMDVRARPATLKPHGSVETFYSLFGHILITVGRGPRTLPTDFTIV